MRLLHGEEKPPVLDLEGRAIGPLLGVALCTARGSENALNKTEKGGDEARCRKDGDIVPHHAKQFAV